MSRPNYLFLIAVGRSGTTVLRKSLGLHPALSYNDRENNLIGDLIETALDNCTKPDRKFSLTVSQDVYQRAFEQLANEIVWSEFNPAHSQIRFASFGIPPTIGDERVAGFADLMVRIFPDARVLHLVRNGIEVIASRQLFVQFRNMPFEEHCRRWARTLEWYKWGQRYPDAYRLARYEWFADEEVMRAQFARWYSWLDIPPEEMPLRHLLSERYHPTLHPKEDNPLQVGDAQRSEQGREQLEQTRQQRWQFWDAEQRALFEKICGDAMREFGYPIPWQTKQTPARASLSFANFFGRVKKSDARRT